MGKQHNYYMEYNSFIMLAEKALEMGCEIIRNEHATKIQRGFSIDVVIPECIYYYFRVPEAGEITIETDMNGKQYVNLSDAGRNCLIEAGFSSIQLDEQHISRNRLYSSTGYYDENDVFIDRPACVTKVYNALVRYSKKLAPQTEIVVKQISTQDKMYLQEIEQKYNHYVTEYCLQLQQKGYRLH